MEANHKSRTFAELSRFIYRSPHWRNLAIPTIAIFLIDFFLLKDVFLVGVGIAGSFLLVLLIDWIFVKAAKFVFPFRRIMFLNFLSLLIWSIFFWIVYLIHFTTTEYLIMISLSLVSFVRVIILYGYYSENSSKTIFPSLNYTYAAIIALYLVFRDPATIVPFLLSSLVYITAGAIFVKRSTRKFIEEFNESPTEMIKFFLNYKSVVNSERIGQRFFEKIYRHSRKVPVKVMDIVSANGKRKVTAVFPYIHPGPFGRIGSSDLPERLKTSLAELDTDLMVFHTTTTNSNNCRGDQDVDSIAEGIRKAMEGMKYSDTMSKFKKITVGKYVVGMQKIGDFAYGALIPEKTPFDDVSLSEGLKVIDSVRGSCLKDFALIDAQNHFTEGVRELDDCSTFIPAFEREFSRMQTRFPARMGYGKVTPEIEGLATMGIQALVMNAGDTNQAIVLTDSNNVTTEVIERAREKTRSMVDGLEIYTTDNHVVNAGSLDMNPLGARCDVEELTDQVVVAVEKAMADVEDVRVAMATETVKVKMGDENSFQDLIELVFSSLKTAKYTLMLAIPLSIITSIVIFDSFLSII
ncbi:hypothetical protein IX51_11565 [uncultured archaeon]|nr:hypothetical protein IX51_11565 [uncultured archaeon]